MKPLSPEVLKVVFQFLQTQSQKICLRSHHFLSSGQIIPWGLFLQGDLVEEN